MHDPAPDTAPATAPWKKHLGLWLLVYSFVPICTTGLVPLLPLSAGQAVTFSVLYLASGEIAFLLAVALLGKPFIEGIKSRIKGFLRRDTAPTPPRPVGRLRHYAGVTLLLGSLVPYYVALAILIISPPGAAALRGLLALLLAGEGLFFLGLFLLGSAFWMRLTRLFVWPGQETPAASAHGPGAGTA